MADINTSGLQYRPAVSWQQTPGIMRDSLNRSARAKAQQEQEAAVLEFAKKEYGVAPAETKQMLRASGGDARAVMEFLGGRKQQQEAQSYNAAAEWVLNASQQGQDPWGQLQQSGWTPQQLQNVNVLAQEKYLNRAQQQANLAKTQAEAGVAGQPKMSEAEQKIQRLMESTGKSRAEVVRGLEDDIMRDPVTGEVVVYNWTDGSVQKIQTTPIELSRESLLAPEQYREPSLDLYNKINVNTTGLAPKMLELVQKGVGAGGTFAGQEWNVLPADTQRTWQEFTSVQRSLVRSLQENPRYPEGERKSIAEEVNITPGAFKDPKTLRREIQGVGEFLIRKLDRAIVEANDPANDQETRKAYRTAARDMAFFLHNMNIPMGSGEEPQEQDGPTDSGGSQLSDDELLAKWGVTVEPESKGPIRGKKRG